jgi:hypothetical protein
MNFANITQLNVAIWDAYTPYNNTIYCLHNVIRQNQRSYCESVLNVYPGDLAVMYIIQVYTHAHTHTNGDIRV